MEWTNLAPNLYAWLRVVLRVAVTRTFTASARRAVVASLSSAAASRNETQVWPCESGEARTSHDARSSLVRDEATFSLH